MSLSQRQSIKLPRKLSKGCWRSTPLLIRDSHSEHETGILLKALGCSPWGYVGQHVPSPDRRWAGCFTTNPLFIFKRRSAGTLSSLSNLLVALTKSWRRACSCSTWAALRNLKLALAVDSFLGCSHIRTPMVSRSMTVVSGPVDRESRVNLKLRRGHLARHSTNPLSSRKICGATSAGISEL